MKHIRISFLSLVLFIICSTALAEACPAGCTLCKTDADCSHCAVCTSAMATARPRGYQVMEPVRTAAPVILPTTQTSPMQTPRPTATKQPGLTPSVPIRPISTKAPSISNADYTTISTAKQEEIVFTLLNQDRAAYGLPALTLDPELSRIARIKCQDMKDNHYFAHESPTYGRAAQMLTHFGYSYNGCGENIAHHATAEKAQAAFISSPAHRINVMGKQWQKVGIGVVYDDQGFVYVTQLFVR